MEIPCPAPTIAPPDNAAAGDTPPWTAPVRHRVRAMLPGDLLRGSVRPAPAKAAWFLGMAAITAWAGPRTLTWEALLLFLGTTTLALLAGLSLGYHRRLVHASFACPRWLECFLYWCGGQAGISGPLAYLRQHELHDYAARLPDSHPFLRHGRGVAVDACWQLLCRLKLYHPPAIVVEPRIARDRFIRLMERTWRQQHLLVAGVFYFWGGVEFVVWGVAARVTACHVCHWYAGHRAARSTAWAGIGPMRMAGIVTMGEVWHHHHREHTGSARLGMLPGEWDPGWWLLRLLRKVGLARDLVLPAVPEKPPLLETGPAAA